MTFGAIELYPNCVPPLFSLLFVVTGHRIVLKNEITVWIGCLFITLLYLPAFKVERRKGGLTDKKGDNAVFTDAFLIQKASLEMTEY